MGLFGKMKDLIGIEEIDVDDITEEEIESASAKLERTVVEPRSSYAASSVRQEPRERREIKENKESKVMPMNRATERTSAFKLVVIEPSSFDECPKLVDNLKARKPVIINLANIDPAIARKIFDFLSGATYALNGNVQKVADYIFVFAPENVDISANIEHKGSDKGIDFNPTVKNNSIWR